MPEVWKPANNVQLLTDLVVPALSQEQLDLFNAQSIHSEKVMDFDSELTANELSKQEGVQVVAADFGGDKGIARCFTIDNGRPKITPEYQDDIQGNDGIGYLGTIQRAAEFASSNDLHVGLSWGGPLDGSKLLFHPKATKFYDEVHDEAEGDLAKVSSAINSVLNDGPAGLISGAVEAYRQFGSKTVLFIINGGGIGLGVLKDGVMYATEAGHVAGHDALNTYKQTAACGVFDADYICLERLGANKAGIEAQWQAEKGEYMRARDIEDQYKAGDEFARDIYDHSAWVVAHVIQGAAQAMDINVADKDVVVVGHGGAFKFPSYGERIRQILSGHVNSEVRLLMTNNFGDISSNACLDGAAIASLVSRTES